MRLRVSVTWLHCSARFTSVLTARPTSRRCCTLTCITSQSGAQLTHRAGRQQATISFTVRPFSPNNSASAGRILIKFLFTKSVEEADVRLKPDKRNRRTLCTETYVHHDWYLQSRQVVFSARYALRQSIIAQTRTNRRDGTQVRH